MRHQDSNNPYYQQFLSTINSEELAEHAKIISSSEASGRTCAYASKLASIIPAIGPSIGSYVDVLGEIDKDTVSLHRNEIANKIATAIDAVTPE